MTHSVYIYSLPTIFLNVSRAVDIWVSSSGVRHASLIFSVFLYLLFHVLRNMRPLSVSARLITRLSFVSGRLSTRPKATSASTR